MPMIDITIPEGAIAPEAEARLIKEITDILIKSEGFDPVNNKVAQSATVAFLHRPAAIYVAGAPATEPRYRVIPTVPEGKYSDEAVTMLVREVTEAFARAEGRSFEETAPLVWVFPSEISEGRWGARGVIRGIADIQAMLAGEHERTIGEQSLATRRRAKALELIEGVADAVRRDVKGT
ncbi:Tautomerase enzyme [Paraburkholderia sp. BCC1886]|uniref:Tautomerase enzyme n=1 Tax=Paraburkholderia sp. BCC1886 TaxID=2562670 RepID=UPI0011843BD0|nr:Tautomerase enzyme [Paraburkholderia sp. BCC1886]